MIKQMLISDLKETCQNCQGSGFQAGHKDWQGIQINSKKNCTICSGKGFNFSELGKNLWDLYLPELRLLIKKEIKKNSIF
tara:strand:- start:2616 stop:2855 length:240 start_codon:yes stop_codon:yes gene_type:complete